MKVTASLIFLLFSVLKRLYNAVFIELKYVEVVSNAVQGDTASHSTAKRDHLHGLLRSECQREH